MNYWTYLTCLCFTFFANKALAQETILTDRPNATDAVSLIAPGTLQLELGYLQTQIEDVNLIDHRFITAPNISLKYGLSERVELRVLTNYAINSTDDNGDITKVSGLTPVTLSPKIYICDQQGLRPKLALSTFFTFANTGSASFSSDKFIAGFRTLAEYTFGDLSWASSIGTDFPDGTIWHYTTTAGYPIFDGFGAFIEFYGSFQPDILNSHYIDGGLTYLITNDFQVDAIYGFNLSGVEQHSFFGFGVAWRTNFKD